MNRKGIALILSFMVIGVLTILSAAIISRSVSERYIVQRYVESTQAFWLAEAGINRALNELRNNYSVNGTNLWSASLGQGRYSVDVEDVIINGQINKKVTAHGFIPSTGQARAERIVEAMMNKYIPPNFYDNAIYSAGEVDFNGNAYSVTGDVIYADEIDNTGNVAGTITQDASISPLAQLDFQQLYSISQSQGNVYDEARLEQVQQNQESFPASFWYSPPTDPNDPATGMPNVVYVEDDLQLNGNIGTIGGFFVVVGDVINTPDITQDAIINGNGQIEGLIYTRGEFRINGGGGNLNIDGGVWAGEEARLNGNAHITYNQDYMDAVRSLDINAEVQITSWKDKQNPYQLTP